MSRFFPLSFPITIACTPDFKDLGETFKIREGCSWSIKGFPNSVKGWGRSSPSGGTFLSGGGNLKQSDFEHSNLFQS